MTRFFTVPVLCATALSTLSFHSFAEKGKALETNVDLGAILTTGNTESTTLKGKINVKHDLNSWRNQFILESLYKEDEITNALDGSSESQTTAQKFFLSGQADLKLDDKYKGFFLYGSYEKDRFSGYNYQSTIALGYSDRLFDTSKSHLNYSIGPGIALAQEDEFRDVNGDLVDGEKTDTIIVRLSADFLYKFSERTRFTQTFSTDFSSDGDKNTKTKAESAISTDISGSLAVKASFAITQNSVVPEGIEKSDTETVFSLVYKF